MNRRTLRGDLARIRTRHPLLVPTLELAGFLTGYAIGVIGVTGLLVDGLPA